MGGWKLEAFKMVVYMAFPVGVFWWFNQPSSFEGWMMEKRLFSFMRVVVLFNDNSYVRVPFQKELFPPEDPRIREKIEETIQTLEKRRQQKLEAELNKQE